MKLGETKKVLINSYLSNRPSLQLTICILMTALILYWQFVFGDKILAYTDFGYDTFHLYLPSCEYFANAIRKGGIPEYNFIYGLGTTNFSLVVLGVDLFAIVNILIGAIWGSQYIGRCMVFVQIAKILCAGLLAHCFLRNFAFSKNSILLAAYIYAFSGYMMTAGQHYIFSIYPVYNMFLLIMIEKIISTKSSIIHYLGLSVSAALICLSGVQTAFAGLSGAAVYFAVRVIVLYGKDVQVLLKKASLCFLFVLNGIMLSSFLLLPSLDIISKSTRLSQSTLSEQIAASFSPANKNAVRSGLLRFFSNSIEGTVNTWSGGTYHWEMFSYFFSAIFVLIIAQYIWITLRRKSEYSFKIKAIRLLPVGLITFAIVCNFIPSYFNVFTYPNYRHAFIYLPLFAIAFADTFDKIKNGIINRPLNLLVLFGSCAYILSCGIELYNQGNRTVAFPMCVSLSAIIGGAVFLDLIAFSGKNCLNSQESTSWEYMQKMLVTSLLLLVILNLFAENYITLYFERDIVTKSKEEAHMINEDVVRYIKSIEGNNLYRFDTDYQEGRMSDRGYSFSLDVPTPSCYNTTSSRYFMDFINRISPSNSWYIPQLYGGISADIDARLAKDLLGIKYYSSVFDLDENEWREISKFNKGVRLYKNQNINSIGLLYNKYITETEANQIDIAMRQSALWNSVIISEPHFDMDEYALHRIPTKKSSYVYNPESISAYDGKITNIKRLGDGKTSFTVVQGKDTSVVVPIENNFNNNSRHTILFSVILDNQIEINYFYYSDMDGTWHNISASSTKTDGSKMKYEFVVSKDACSIGIALGANESVDFVVASEAIESTVEYINEGVQLSCPDFDGKIVGTIDAVKNSILFIPVLYDGNWEAYIDGQAADILRANYAFCALKIPFGSHKIELHHQNRSYKIGAVLTMISALVSIAVLTIVLLKKKSIIQCFVKK